MTPAEHVGAGSAARRLPGSCNSTIQLGEACGGHGVPAVRTDTTGSFADALSVALRENGPLLIEAVMP